MDRCMSVCLRRPRGPPDSKSCRTSCRRSEAPRAELPSCVGGVKTVYLAGALWKTVRFASSKLPALTRDEIISKSSSQSAAAASTSARFRAAR